MLKFEIFTQEDKQRIVIIVSTWGTTTESAQRLTNSSELESQVGEVRLPL